MSATNAPTQLSTAASAVSVSPVGGQSLPFAFSSYSKQPFVESLPPSNLLTTFALQAVVSLDLPGVSTVSSHVSSPVAFLDMHFVLPARHIACS